jgi:hypothetical protein
MANDPQQAELNKDHLDFAWKTHEYIHNYIRFSDTKAAFVVTWCLALVGALSYVELHKGVLKGQLSLSAASFTTSVAAVGFALLGGALGCAIRSVMPTLWTEQRAGLVFWESIKVYATGDIYANALGKEKVDGLARHLCVQTHMVAKVAAKKYWWVGLSLWLALGGTVSSVLAVALKVAAP